MQAYLLAFESTHDALAASDALAALAPKVVPMPRDVSAGCGICLLLDAADDAAALLLLEQLGPNSTATAYKVEGRGCHRAL